MRRRNPIAGRIDCQGLDQAVIFIADSRSVFSRDIYHPVAKAICEEMGLPEPPETRLTCESLLEMLGPGQEYHWRLLEMIEPLFQEAWRSCKDGGKMLHVADYIYPEREPGVSNDELRLAACSVAESVSRYFRDTRPADAIRISRMYAGRKATLKDMEKASLAAFHAEYDSRRYVEWTAASAASAAVSASSARVDSTAALAAWTKIVDGIDEKAARSGYAKVLRKLLHPTLALLLR